MNQTLNLGEIQFYWRVTDKPNVPTNVVPNFLPFEFTFEESTQLVRQKKYQVILDALEKIYLEEFNVGYLQEGHDLAEGYGNDVLKFVNKSVTNYLPNAKRILEVGCGGGYMLNKFRAMGLEVMGVDPSPIAVTKGVEFKYDVIKDFYPTKQTFEKVDIIFHYDVLEHIENHIDFLKEHKRDLTDNGMIVFAVPDDTECLAVGDISMVIHEHINYFDKESLANTVSKAGFEVLDVQKSNHGGVLYCAARKINGDGNYQDKSGIEKFENFITEHQLFRKRITDYIDTILADENNVLGIYIALRVAPYLTKYKDSNRIRFFDDDSGLHHKYYDGYNVTIENMNDLVAKPVTHLLIATHSFGKIIHSKVVEKVSYPIEITLLNDFIKHN